MAIKTIEDQSTDYEKNIGQFHENGDDYEEIEGSKYWANMSRKWASEVENIPVENSQYSSLHHSRKSAASATESAGSASNSAASANSSELSRQESFAQANRSQSEADRAESLADQVSNIIPSIVDAKDQAISEIQTEGSDQIQLVIQEGSAQEARIISEGDTQEARIISEGDTQEARIIAEGDTQHGRAKVEADRAQTIANDLDDAARWSGYFAPSGGSYPAPRDQTKPFQWIAADDGTVDGLAWKAGELLFYAPNPTNAQLDGAYFKLSGEATDSPIDPQPIEIPDDLVMQQDKEIYFRNPTNELVQFGTLDADGDILIGEATEGLPAAPKIGLAANELYHIKELDSTGKATILFPIVTTEGGEVARDPSTVLRTYGDVSIAGVKKFVEPIHVLNDRLLMNMHGDTILNQDVDGNTYLQAGDHVDFRSPNAPVWSTDGTDAKQLATEAFVNGLDSANVKRTGDQSIAGTKTFTSPANFGETEPYSITLRRDNANNITIRYYCTDTGDYLYSGASAAFAASGLGWGVSTSNNLTDGALLSASDLGVFAGVQGVEDNALTRVDYVAEQIATRAPTSHTHTIANVTDLQTELDGKAATAHTHTIANVTDLQTELDGKAAASHTHAQYAPLAGAAFTGAVTSTGDITAFLGGRSASQQKIDAYTGQNGTTAYDAVAKLVEVVEDLQAQIDALKTP